jgi:hypothetical protein
MGKLLRNRTLCLVIAIFAFMAFARAGAVQGMATGMQMCHAPMQSPTKSQRDGAMQDHSCCKACVCHFGSSVPPSAPYSHAFPPASHDVIAAPLHAAMLAGIFSNKSSPRGPPLHVRQPTYV